VQQELAALIERKAITVTVEQPSLLPPVQTNLNHLRVVVRNLLENGVKYTPTGGTVVITLTKDGEFLRCQVHDTGQGIAPEELPHVRKRFHRAALARQRHSWDGTTQEEHHDGSGLGLALVDSIVALYGGRVEIASEGRNQGTTVTVWWPFEQEPA
jgi:signal transduction histidine kinase